MLSWLGEKEGAEGWGKLGCSSICKPGLRSTFLAGEGHVRSLACPLLSPSGG